MSAPAQAACSVCSEPADGGACCGRCGYPFPAGTPAAFAPMPAPQPAAPKPGQKKSAAADLEEAFKEALPPQTPRNEYPTPAPLPKAGSVQPMPYGDAKDVPLPQAGSVQPLSYGESGAGGPVLPEAGRREHSFDTPVARPSPKTSSKRSAAPASLLPIGFSYIVKSALSIAFLLALVAAAVILLLSQRQSQKAEAAAPRLAKSYLSALATTDYASAYYLLSIASQARCTMDEFRKMRGPGEWSWSNLRLVSDEPDAAEVAYDWSAPGAPPQTTYLFFVRENERWVVAYNLNLLRRVEDAMRQSDPDLALLESQEAVRVNPRDPMARAYLCEAANFRKLSEQARPECRSALELAAKYPSNLSAESLAHLKTVTAALEQGK